MDDKSIEAQELADGRMQRKALLFIWLIIGLVGLATFCYGHYQLSRARASRTWPSVDGEIFTSRIKRHTDDEGTHYSADIEYRYRVDGKEFESSVIVIGGHSYSAHGAVGRYPQGQQVKVAYNPSNPHQAVLEPGVESTQMQTIGVGVMFGALFMAILFNFILRHAMNEEKSILDHSVLLLLKSLFLPFVISNGNPLIMGAMVGCAYWITTFEIHPSITFPAMIFTAVYGLGFILMLWGAFLGWLMSLGDHGEEDEASA